MLAQLCNTNPTNFSTAVNELVSWRYLHREAYLHDGRRFVYRVIYDDLPRGKPSESNRLPPDKQSAEIVSPSESQIVCPEPIEIQPVQTLAPDEYIQEENLSITPNLKKNRNATTLNNLKHDQLLDAVEAELRAGTKLDPFTARSIEEVLNRTATDDPNHLRAAQILDSNSTALK